MQSDPTRKITEAEIKQVVRDAFAAGTLVVSSHAKERMAERGYSIRDVFHILTDGSLTESVYNDKAQNWKYTFHGEDLDGDGGGVVIAVASHRQCVVITVLS